MTTLELLKEVRELFLDKNKWTRGVLAKDATGMGVMPKSPTACQWCLDGALELLSDSVQIKGEARERLNRFASRYYGSQAFTQFNDNNTYEKVMELLNKAIDSYY